MIPDFNRALSSLRPLVQQAMVIRVDRSLTDDAVLLKAFAEDIAALQGVGIQAVIVHDADAVVDDLLSRVGLGKSDENGFQPTDRASVEMAEIAMGGVSSKKIAAAIVSAGGQAIGLTGRDGGMLIARRPPRITSGAAKSIPQIRDGGFVGEIEEINAGLIHALCEATIVPVIAPIGVGRTQDGILTDPFMLDADIIAGALAMGLGAARLLMLSAGGMIAGEAQMRMAQARKMLSTNQVPTGLIGKVEMGLAALEETVDGVWLLESTVPHVTLNAVMGAAGENGTYIEQDS